MWRRSKAALCATHSQSSTLPQIAASLPLNLEGAPAPVPGRRRLSVTPFCRSGR